MKEQYVWLEKYRPKTISECILPDRIRKVAEKFIKEGNMQSLLLVGKPSAGKTTFAKALVNDLDANRIIINGSKEGRYIDTLNTSLDEFVKAASARSYKAPFKVVVLDEADYLNANSFQPALRNFIETYAKSTRFILTCNYPYKILEPIRTRLLEIDFDLKPNEIQESKKAWYARLTQILELENVKIKDKKDVATLVKSYYPDSRAMLHALQQFSNDGVFSLPEQGLPGISRVDEAIEMLKSRNFLKLREWLQENPQETVPTIAQAIYNRITDVLAEDSIAEFILIADEHDKAQAVSTLPWLNIMAFLIKIMQNLEFKQ